MEDLEYSVNNTAVFPCNYIFTFLSGLHVSTYFLGYHQVLLLCYLFRSICKANIDFIFGWYYIICFHSVRYCILKTLCTLCQTVKYNTTLSESIEYNISQKENQYWLCKVSEINNKLVGPDDGLENRLKHVVQIKT